MMKEYIVSIKNGNYKTSAWVVGFDKRFGAYGDVLKLKGCYRSDQQLNTVVYDDGVGNFHMKHTLVNWYLDLYAK